MVLSGNTSVSNFSTTSPFRIWKSIGRGYSSRSSQVFGLPSPTQPPLSTLLVFVTLLGYSYIHPPSSHLLSWYLTASHPQSIFRSLYKNPPRLRLSFWRWLIPFWHTRRGPLIRVSAIPIPCCHRAPLRCLAQLRRAGPHSHFLAQADIPHLSDVTFLCLGFIHSFCLLFWLFVDVVKGSPLLPACFFPFYFLRMYVYVGRFWLGNGRDVRLVLYQRDLGVWMFPEVRRLRFLLAIALKLNAVFVPFFLLYIVFFLV